MLAEQVLWEEFSNWPGFQVQGVDYGEGTAGKAGKYLVASIQCLYPPGARKGERLERLKTSLFPISLAKVSFSKGINLRVP